MFDEFRAQTSLAPVTRENHPENQPEPAPAPAPPRKGLSLASMIGLSVMGGVIGMAYGVAAFASALGDFASMLSLAPLVAALVALEAGYWGAMVWMCREGSAE
jgi:hypothetical protein